MSFFKGKINRWCDCKYCSIQICIFSERVCKNGANVRAIQTPESQQFITPLTLSTLSKNPVLSGLVKKEDKDVWNNHVEIGLGPICLLLHLQQLKHFPRWQMGNVTIYCLLPIYLLNAQFFCSSYGFRYV